MKRILLSVIFLFLSFSAIKLRADHVMGADMSYKCLGNGKYKIIIVFYRDCRGAAAPPSWSILSWYVGQNGGNSCGGGSSGFQNFQRTGIRDITPRCSTANKPCSPQNTDYTGEGVEEHTYETEIDITKTPFAGVVGKSSSCCELTIAYNQCCRNEAITTGATWQDFWTTCVINVCNISKSDNKCNTSPKLTNAPIAYACCNQPYYFNNGASDTVDYDSLSYRLAPALRGVPANSVTYSTPFSYKYPLTPYCVPATKIDCPPNLKTDPPRGFFLDTSTGDLVFTPTKCDEVAILCLEITEWRKDTLGKYIWVGKTRRDIQIIVKDDCGYNKTPKITGPTVNKVCEGDKICFDIEGKDETFTPYQTIPDTVQMKWNNGIPGGTFTIKNPSDREKTAQFCWQTKVGQASEIAYAFTVTATDDHCPKPSLSTRGFKVKVNFRAFDTRKYTILKCGRFAYEAKLPEGFRGVAQYKWSFRDSNGNNEFYFSSKKSDTMTFYKGGRYIVVHTVNNSDNCPTIYRDTIDIPNPPTAVLATKDTFACYKTKLVLEASVLYAKLPYKYYWTRPLLHMSGDTFNSITLGSVDRDSTIMVQVTDGDGCNFWDTATVFVKPLPNNPGIADQRICTYQQATFDAQHADTMYYLWNTGDTTRNITNHIAGDYIVTITDTIWGCQMTDTAHLFVNDTVVSLAGSDKIICNNDKYDIIANHRNASLIPVYQWTDLKTGTVLGSNQKYTVQPKNTNSTGGSAQFFTYELFTKVTQVGVTCEHRDTMSIKVNTLPLVSWTKNPLDQKCHDYGDIRLDPFINRPLNSLWKQGNIMVWGTKTGYGYKSGLNNNGLLDSINYDAHYFRTKKINNATELNGGKNIEDVITLWFKDTNGCINTATTRQRINGNPIIILDTSIYCQDKGWAKMDSSVISPKTKFGNKQSWQVLQVPSGVDPSLVLVDNSFGAGTDWELHFGNPTQDFYAGNYILKFSVTDQVTGCFDTDTTMVKIITEPNVAVSPPSLVCLNWDTLDLRDYIKLNGFKPNINTNNWFTILEYKNQRNHPKVTSTVLDKGYMFLPASGGGTWLIKFSSDETGCLREDSFFVDVIDTPSATLLPPITVCSSGTPLDLNSRITNVQPSSSTVVWSGWNVSPGSSLFPPKSKDSATLEGPYAMFLELTNSSGCKGHYTYPVTVRSQPEVKITSNKPLTACQRTPVNVTSTSKYSDQNNVNWVGINGADGNISNPAAQNIVYVHGNQDSINNYAWLKVSTVAIPNEVCPQAVDSIQIILHPYPAPVMTSPFDSCVPFTLNFYGSESKNIPLSQLSWDWDFGNSITSAVQNPTGIAFSQSGKYTVTLKVTNDVGPCATTISEPDFVEAYPNPVADFTTDPAFKTTVALPKFTMRNLSTLDQAIFNGSMSYQWDFGDPLTDPNDVSNLENPKYAYGKDTNTYYITLLVTSNHGCVSTITKSVVIGPDIIVFIPDVFTPEGSGPGRNETFMISALNFKTMKLLIFNRWGEKLYETTDVTKGWDGRSNGEICPDGVYIYKIQVEAPDGKIYNYDGTVTLMR
ncbi:MAG: gliding motility-associated C-terminal domain-containing protein [Bacteroidetes bacterium]|nr:gliding motility-associated C-terminal domain-containing protein [Bacteroidota bacterium]